MNTVNIEHVNEWVGALRSGSYEQGQGFLHYVEGVNHYLCCLGVGSKIAGVERRWRDNESGGVVDGWYVYADDHRVESRQFNEWLGLLPGTIRLSGTSDLVEQVTTLRAGQNWGLATLNDSGFTFDQIADLIDYFGITTEVFS